MFLENGQTKSFKYDSSTTVQDVIDSLVAKLGIRDSAHFSLVVEHIKSLKRNKLTILDPRERLAVVSLSYNLLLLGSVDGCAITEMMEEFTLLNNNVMCLDRQDCHKENKTLFS